MAFPKQPSPFPSMSAGKSGKTVDPTKPFPAPQSKGATPAPKGKKPSVKIDIMLAKAMPGVSMPPKKGGATPMAKKNPKSGGKNMPMSGNVKSGKKPC